MRMTSKGPVTIPIEIRTLLALGPAPEVEVKLVGNAVEMRGAPGGWRGRRGMERWMAARYPVRAPMS